MLTKHHNSQQTIIAQYADALVVGLGVTGFSVVRYLKLRGLRVTVIDSRENPILKPQLQTSYPDVDCYFGDFDQAKIKPFKLVVVSPGVSLKEPFMINLKNSGAHIVGDIELFVEENTKPLIAITGSNGKSTVTSLVGEMCCAADIEPLVAGNIGVPVLDSLVDEKHYDVAVLELSSFQLETTSRLNADAAAILNISADHMDRYESMGDYTLAKARILRGAKQIILPRHDEQLSQITSNGRLLNFDLDEPANDSEYGIRRASNDRWLMKGAERLIRLAEISLTGLHNVKNVLAAFALVDFLKLPMEHLVSAVKSFTGLPHRMQTIANTHGVTWVNDSKATNIGATATALKNIEKDIVWIAGGQGKGADFTELREAIGRHVKSLILMGEDADEIEIALKGAIPITRVLSMAEAVQKANEVSSPNSIVLLSPACASFDMYQGFEQRGEDFMVKVQQLTERGAA